MSKRDDPNPPAWFLRIGIDVAGRRICGKHGVVTITADPDGTHRLWIYDHVVQTGDHVTIRNMFARHVAGTWLEIAYPWVASRVGPV